MFKDCPIVVCDVLFIFFNIYIVFFWSLTLTIKKKTIIVIKKMCCNFLFGMHVITFFTEGFVEHSSKVVCRSNYSLLATLFLTLVVFSSL